MSDRSPREESRSERKGGLGKVEETARGQSLFMTGARIMAAILTMAIPLVLVRVLDQSTFGTYKQLFLVAGTAEAVLVLGIPASLYYFVPRARKDAGRFHLQSLLLLGTAGLLGGAAIYLGRGLLDELLSGSLSPYLGWIALFTALALPASLISASPMVDKRARLAALLVVASDLVRSALLVGVAVLTGSLEALLAAACALMALQVLAVGTYLTWRGGDLHHRPTVGGMREQLGYALPFAAAALIGLARSKAHAFYVAASFSAAEFAVYSVATLNVPLIGQFGRTVGEVVVLENAEHFAENRLGEMRRVWHRATHVLALALIPIFVIGEVFAPEVIRLLFGAQYLDATPIFRVFLLTIPSSILLASPMLRATGDLGVMIVADVISLVVTLGVLFSLAGALGPLAAVGSLVAGIATFGAVASGRTARRLELGVRDFLPWGNLLKITLASLVSAVLGYLVVEFVELPLIIRLGVGGCVALGIYAAAAWFTRLVPEAERDLLVRLLLRRGGGSTAGPADEAPL